MSRSYNPKPWVDKSGVSFADGGSHGDGGDLRLRHNVSYAPAQSFPERLRTDWNARRPYYIIMISIGLIIVLSIGLLIYASRA